nr:hypothetical protein TetV2_00137 [Oceanusvirus sp.]
MQTKARAADAKTALARLAEEKTKQAAQMRAGLARMKKDRAEREDAVARETLAAARKRMSAATREAARVSRKAAVFERPPLPPRRPVTAREKTKANAAERKALETAEAAALSPPISGPEDTQHALARSKGTQTIL